MTGSHGYPALRPAPGRGLWQALVEADIARRSGSDGIESTAAPAEPVIDLAVRTQAHLGYLERLAPVEADATESAATESDAVVFDLDAHRARRALIA